MSNHDEQTLENGLLVTTERYLDDHKVRGKLILGGSNTPADVHKPIASLIPVSIGGSQGWSLEIIDPPVFPELQTPGIKPGLLHDVLEQLGSLKLS